MLRMVSKGDLFAAVLEVLEGFQPMGRHEVGAGGKELAEFDESGAEIFEILADGASGGRVVGFCSCEEALGILPEITAVVDEDFGESGEAAGMNLRSS